MESLPYSKSCFVCGAHNPLGMKLRFETDGTIARTRFVPRPEHNGFTNVVHGGLVATVLDEVMVWALGVKTGKFTYCAELTVRYAAPTRPGETIIGTGELVENKKDRLLIAKGELRNEKGELLASATGKYIPVKDMDYEGLLADFVGTKEELERMFPKFRNQQKRS